MLDSDSDLQSWLGVASAKVGDVPPVEVTNVWPPSHAAFYVARDQDDDGF